LSLFPTWCCDSLLGRFGAVLIALVILSNIGSLIKLACHDLNAQGI